jgi:hypothetical protein
MREHGDQRDVPMHVRLRGLHAGERQRARLLVHLPSQREHPRVAILSLERRRALRKALRLRLYVLFGEVLAKK